MRSVFDTQDASYQVRVQNRALMLPYMASRPFGVGIGLGGQKAREYAPNAYMSQIATDSWFVLIWVETGIVGLFLYLGFYIFFFIYGGYLVSKIQHKELKGIICALLSGTFGMMVSSYANEVIGQYPNGYILYICQAFVFLAPVLDKELTERVS